ncbi:MAG: PLP-dependent aspartate aminotransferase family protein [Bacteriovoracaceae bacterium]
MKSNWKVNTKLNHPPQIELKPGNRPLLSPVYHSAKFTPSEDYPFWDQYLYGRVSNPTTRQLELSLADLQNKQDCIVVSSGIAAITGVFLALLKSNDHIISFKELYKPSRLFIKEHLSKFGIENTILSLSESADLEKFIIPGKTKLIHFESPTNPTLAVADIEWILKVAKKHNVLVSMDGTFAGLHQHTHFDIDIMIHSLTKYANGHGDVIAGSIAGGKDLIGKIREMCIYLGATIDPQTSNLISRGLKTYMLRYERQTQSAMAIADYLSKHSKIKRVFYPGLKTHAGYELAQKQMKDMGGIISFEVDESLGPAERICHQFKLIQLTASVGSTESIICPTLFFFGQDLSLEDRESLGITPYTLRLSIGLEDASDLIQDLESVLNGIN